MKQAEKLSCLQASLRLASGFDRHGFSLAARLIGEPGAHRPASVPSGAACCGRCGAPVSPVAADQPHPAMQQTPGGHQ